MFLCFMHVMAARFMLLHVVATHFFYHYTMHYTSVNYTVHWLAQALYGTFGPGFPNLQNIIGGGHYRVSQPLRGSLCPVRPTQAYGWDLNLDLVLLLLWVSSDVL
jgi:hypothetical protein